LATWQPVIALHESLVHGLPSSQTIGLVTQAPERHCALAVQAVVGHAALAAGSSSVMPLQSSSRSLQRSAAPGNACPSLSSQSIGPQGGPSGEGPPF